MFNLGGGSATPKDDGLVVDATDATFMQDVVEASRDKPVIVDFWAPWCGPCKTLGPALEKAVREAGGAVRMVKIDIEQNPAVAGQMQIQSIPAVFAFVDGQPVDGFMGAQPPAQLKQFVDRVAQMGGGEGGDGLEAQIVQYLDAADAALAEGQAAEAAQVFAQILGADPENPRAFAGLVNCYLKLGDVERARAALEAAPEGLREAAELKQAASAVALAEEGAKAAGQLASLEARLAADPDDHEARLDLARAMAGTDKREEAVEHLLELFRRDSEWNDGAARAELFKLFDAFGPKDPLTAKGRRRLSSMVFS